ncbi:M60 family metallopeptidase [Myxococcota bacterium]|nr:M60 family metallopeptidase [Myxococcota bacterium]
MLISLLALACAPSSKPSTDDSSTKDSGADTQTDTQTDTAAQAERCAEDAAEILAGVTELELGGALPSRLIPFGEGACPLLADPDGAVAVASARLGEGRLAQLGHEGLLTGAAGKGAHGPLLVQNLARWAAAGKDAPRIGVERDLRGVITTLEAAGLSAEIVDADALAELDLFIAFAPTERDEAEIAALQAFVSGGGGLLTAGHAWWWAYERGASAAEVAAEHPANKLLLGAGLLVSAETTGDDTLASAEPRGLLHAGWALTLIEDHLSGAAPLSMADQRVAADTVGAAVRNLPLDLDAYFGPLRRLLDEGDPMVPTEAEPLKVNQRPIEALLVTVWSRLAGELPPEELTAIPSDFPGPVPAAAVRGDTTLTLRAAYAGRDADYWYSDAADPLWLSLGAYAAPGEPVTVTIPAAWAGRGLKAQIGAHTDTLWHLDEWRRHPELTRAYDLDAAETLIASAFGGPIYLTVPGGLDLGEGEVTVSGGVSMPRYVVGETETAAFLAEAAANLAPLAELGSDRFVLTVPTADLAALTDPAGLMALWDAVLDADADLAAISRDRDRPERFAIDVQISAGWMHSGYPLMGYDYGAAMVDLPTLSLMGDWGAFHELGHNHQFGPANLPGTTECTVNLWSVYAMEEVIGLDRGLAHSDLDPAARQETLDAYLDGGADFWADWSVWTCLETYLQLQEAFGWDLFITMNAAHLGMPTSSRPDTDQERIDELVILSSETVGLDLTGFYLAWGFPLSASVEPELAHLPPWTDHPLASSAR